MVNTALLNWTGVSVTQNASSLARSTLDTSRTVFVWIASLIFGWEYFLWEELVGFVLLVFGTLVYNEVLVLPFWGFREAVWLHGEE